LHDTFGVPFEEIAPIVDCSPEAARQLASRARQRVRGSAPAPDADLTIPSSSDAQAGSALVYRPTLRDLSVFAQLAVSILRSPPICSTRGRINIFERWESQAARETFRSSGPDYVESFNSRVRDECRTSTCSGRSRRHAW
jgi:hypothetical protein